MPVAADILYYDETFIIVPAAEEISRLRQAITDRIQGWDLTPSDYPRVTIRVRATGYALDRGAVLEVLREEFGRFKYCDGKGPDIDKLSISDDRQREAIAARTMELIDSLAWDYGGDEPEKEAVKLAALHTIYGTGGSR
jgi:hypothetical protein